MARATIRDVAREAGVSVATASNAMNNPEIVRPQTRELVLAAAERLAYVPNANGQRLRAKSSHVIGLFVGSMANEFYGALADSMFHALRERGYELQVSIVDSPRSILPRLNDHTLDGVVVFHDGVDEMMTRQMIDSEVPMVLLAKERSGEHYSSILYESREQGRMAASYLLGLGKRRLMHIFGLPGNFDSEMRWLGFREELDRQGFADMEVPRLEGMFERAVAYRKMRKYLQEGHPLPDAIFASNDLSAMGCIAALNEAGYRVPEDVSMLGCDDITLCEYITPSLTTIRTHFWETGEIAAREVLRLIRGNPGRILRQSGSLIVRQSCTASKATD